MQFNLFSVFNRRKETEHREEINSAVQRLNICHTIYFSILLIAAELLNLVWSLSADLHKQSLSPLSICLFLFLLLIAADIACCKRLLKLEHEKSALPFRYHTYAFTAIYALFCLLLNEISMQCGVSVENVFLFYIYIAAGPVCSLGEALAAVLIPVLCLIPVSASGQAPAAVYSNLFLYSFISVFLSQMRSNIVRHHLRLLMEAREEKQHLKEQADTDSLTGLLNRNGYELRLKDQISQAIRHQLPVAVIMADIDFFKQYNDTYGHMEGDKCLKKIASALTCAIGCNDGLICRFGGEEFQLFLLNVKSCEAVMAADLLRQAVADLKIPSAGRGVSPFVTISVGAAGGLLTSMEDYYSLSEAADRELYHSKYHGKNMVSFQEPKVFKGVTAQEPAVSVAGSLELTATDSSSKELTAADSGSKELAKADSGSKELAKADSGSKELAKADSGSKEPVAPGCQDGQQRPDSGSGSLEHKSPGSRRAFHIDKLTLPRFT